MGHLKVVCHHQRTRAAAEHDIELVGKWKIDLPVGIVVKKQRPVG
jgi:hypothetical protein